MRETLQPEMDSIYTVAQLNEEARYFLEEAFQQVWVTGEISNLSRPSSGHMYFSLKDSDAQIDCALFRMTRRSIDMDIENGQQVLALAQVTLYEARGRYQLVIKHMEPAGAGALQIAFNKLKEKLQAEGLFDESHKQAIPELPKCIGVVTSPSAAAVRDIIRVLQRRFASIPVIIYPTQVQGEQAAVQIVDAIEVANRREECDVLIVARGGGSLEDLWSFNEEIVARAIFNSDIPIVSGVGHEVDFTIADFVADVRAATPSAAAELLSPDKSSWMQTLQHHAQHLQRTMRTILNTYHEHIKHLQQRLRHPGHRLQEYAQRLDQLEQHLKLTIKNVLRHKQSELANVSRTLDAISPLQTLQRGYALVLNAETGELIRSVNDVKKGDALTNRLSDGEVVVSVEAVTKGNVIS